MKKTLIHLVVFAILLSPAMGLADEEVDFNRDIRPILSSKCFACHGPDRQQREADLRLDRRETAIELGTIVPGKPDESEMIRRIFSKDPDEVMPPVDSNDSLSDRQKQLLRSWIQAGAKYDRHWAFDSPQRPPVPKSKNSHWPRNEIDRFVLSRLETAGLVPSPEADRYTLIRRVFLDLTGLLPTIAEADAFAGDRDPKAWEKLIDRLLDSKQYGERWARLWLDLARYADTNGYEKDRSRSIWPYRDWVIRALNDDMPFDQFSIEQLAGDMLPKPTISQRIATGFHRNTMLNEEGGIDPLEYRFYAMVDRVATTGTVWMGLSLGCAQCHSHKFDPITHTDYYSLMALMNNADEPDLFVPDPAIAQQRQRLAEKIATLENELPAHFPPDDQPGSMQQRRKRHLDHQFSVWAEKSRAQVAHWSVLRPVRLETNLPKLEVLEDGSIFSSGDITKRDVYKLTFQLAGLGKQNAKETLPRQVTALRLQVIPDERLPARGPGRAYYEGRKGDFFLSEFKAKFNGKPLEFSAGSHSYGKISIGSGNANAENVFDGKGSTGWSTSGREGKQDQLVLNLAQPLTSDGKLEIELLFERHFAASLGRFRIATSGSSQVPQASQFSDDVEALLEREPKTLAVSENAVLKKYFLSVTPELAEARKQITKLRRQLPDFPTTMVMQQRPADNPRKSYLHHRGEYLSPQQEVVSKIPEVFASPDTDQPTDRLAFARWLVSEKNPLVGRVTVNRTWQAFFGQGMVTTSEDFGTQGDPPTHPELLDWLACEFVEQGWSMKKLHRLIVMSATYRQSSQNTPTRMQHDPQNRLLARGSRLRVDAEIVRDMMLKASGLLSAKMYGPSVYPPQLASVTALAYGSTKWPVSSGEDRYRRSLYTFSKRTAPFAAYMVFDSPSGENCVARRNRSNTPLQALTLLNDEMFLEMSRALAKKTLHQNPRSDRETATILFRRLLTRPPKPEELSALIEYQKRQMKRLESKELSASDIAGEKNATPESASWAMVARVIMNLDETITKQ